MENTQCCEELKKLQQMISNTTQQERYDDHNQQTREGPIESSGMATNTIPTLNHSAMKDALTERIDEWLTARR